MAARVRDHLLTKTKRSSSYSKSSNRNKSGEHLHGLEPKILNL